MQPQKIAVICSRGPQDVPMGRDSDLSQLASYWESRRPKDSKKDLKHLIGPGKPVARLPAGASK